MADLERFEIARLFGHDPSLLRHIPKSELRKRRAYWKLLKKVQNPEESNEAYSVEKTGVELEATATIVGAD